MRPKRLAYKIEPTLRIHKYVCAIHTITDEKMNVEYKYVMTLKEVNKIKQLLDPGKILQVFKADHNFIFAYEGR